MPIFSPFHEIPSFDDWKCRLGRWNEREVTVIGLDAPYFAGELQFEFHSRDDSVSRDANDRWEFHKALKVEYQMKEDFIAGGEVRICNNRLTVLLIFFYQILVLHCIPPTKVYYLSYVIIYFTCHCKMSLKIGGKTVWGKYLFFFILKREMNNGEFLRIQELYSTYLIFLA